MVNSYTALPVESKLLALQAMTPLFPMLSDDGKQLIGNNFSSVRGRTRPRPFADLQYHKHVFQVYGISYNT